MAAPDYIQFEPGNPITEAYCGHWFQTLDLFGYFEVFRVHIDGTIWLTPTQLTPSDRIKTKLGAPELIKVELPPVQILFDCTVNATSVNIVVEIEFTKGIVTKIGQVSHTTASAA